MDPTVRERAPEVEPGLRGAQSLTRGWGGVSTCLAREGDCRLPGRSSGMGFSSDRRREPDSLSRVTCALRGPRWLREVEGPGGAVG